MTLLVPRRRSVLAGISASLLPLPAIAASKQVTATIAMITTSQGNGAQFLYMKRERLFEKYAAQFGYDLQTRYLNFQTGPQVTEGMVKGDIDFGIAGYLPMARLFQINVPGMNLGDHRTPPSDHSGDLQCARLSSFIP